LENVGLQPDGPFAVPFRLVNYMLVGEILIAIEEHLHGRQIGTMFPISQPPAPRRIYEPAAAPAATGRTWQQQRAQDPGPPGILPELIGYVEPALIREYLFISLCFRPARNRWRARMPADLRDATGGKEHCRAFLEDLSRLFNRQRQSSIDAELSTSSRGSKLLPDGDLP